MAFKVYSSACFALYSCISLDYLIGQKICKTLSTDGAHLLASSRDSKDGLLRVHQGHMHSTRILHQICKLTATESQLSATAERDPPRNPLLTFPCKAALQHLVMQTTLITESFVADPHAMTSITGLLTQAEDHMLRVQAPFRDAGVLEFKVSKDCLYYENALVITGEISHPSKCFYFTPSTCLHPLCYRSCRAHSHRNLGISNPFDAQRIIC